VVNLILVVFLIIIGTSIWGLNKSEIAIFITSVLTVLGVAFFAQWSHISNVTSGVILFFNSNIKIGDHITILDKDFNISGTIEDIGALFLRIKTDDSEIISLPNNIILQKAIKIK
jgi:small-conductance mechanosensitive channel